MSSSSDDLSASASDDLPEGVVDADPVGGWQSGETASRVSDEPVAPDSPIEGSEPGQTADPDLSNDASDDAVEAEDQESSK